MTREFQRHEEAEVSLDAEPPTPAEKLCPDTTELRKFVEGMLLANETAAETFWRAAEKARFWQRSELLAQWRCRAGMAYEISTLLQVMDRIGL
jgi:hypothetical protein